MELKNIIQIVAVFAVLALGWPGSARAANGDDRAKKIQIGVPIGFTLGPKGLATGLDANFYLTNNISLAPQFSYVSLDNGDLFMIVAEGRYTLDFKGTNIENSLKPWVGVGTGMYIADPDAAGIKADKDGLIQMSAGLDYYATQQFSFGSNMSTIFPLGSRVDHFVFRWHVVEAKVMF